MCLCTHFFNKSDNFLHFLRNKILLFSWFPWYTISCNLPHSYWYSKVFNIVLKIQSCVEYHHRFQHIFTACSCTKRANTFDTFNVFRHKHTLIPTQNTTPLTTHKHHVFTSVCVSINQHLDLIYSFNTTHTLTQSPTHVAATPPPLIKALQAAHPFLSPLRVCVCLCSCWAFRANCFVGCPRWAVATHSQRLTSSSSSHKGES